MAKDYNFKRSLDKGGSGPASGMHLFDFNETLSGRRLPEDKRIAIELQMDRLYRGRGSVDFPTPRHSGAKREDAEIIRTMLKTSDKKLHQLPNGNEFVVKELSTREKQRSPNVVARLMGLETLPSDSVPMEQSKKQLDKVPHKSVVEKQSRKQRQRQDSPPAEMPAQKEVFYGNPSFYHPEDKVRFNQSRRSEDRKQSAAQELPDLFELEEMKRQLALKQMLVREKLNEAKRLLTGEKLSDKKWQAANEKLNHSKEFLDAIDFFQTNREAFLNYLDEQDSVLSKHLQNLPGTLPRQHAAEKPPPEGLRNPIVRKVIEGRRDDELRLFLSRQSDVKGINRNYSPSRDNTKNPLPDNQAPTRIVVLKPSPNRNPSFRHTPPSGSPRTYPDVRDLIESTRPQVVVKKVADIPKDEATANPREIAKEIARQVRENVVRELARNVTGTTAVELSSRVHVTNDNQEPPKLGTRGISSDYMRTGGTGASSLPTEGLTTATSKNNKIRSRVPLEHVDECSRKPLHSVQKKTTRLGAIRQASGSSPQVTRPVSKGIVVLVPDPSVSSKVGKVSEVQNREIVQATNASKQPSRKDRSRRNQPVLSETPAHKLGDSFRKTRSVEPLKPDIEFMPEESVNSGKDETGEKTIECSLDSGAVCSKEQSMANSGSFLSKTSCSESQGDNEESQECSHVKDTVESEVVSNMRFQSDSLRPQSDCVSSSESFLTESLLTGPTSVLITQTEFEPEISKTVQSSSECHVTDIEVVQELEVSREQEPARECTMTADVVDVDETSVSSDNSGQPSPVSVLESSFEESPDRVDFETISSELEELRMHLRLLKWEDHDDDEARLDDLKEVAELDTVIVDKIVVEDHSGSSIQKIPVVLENAGVQDAIDGLEWLEWETFQIRDLHFPDGRKEDQVYVKNILLASGFISNTNAGIFLAEQHSSGHALDPSLFEKLEGYYKLIEMKAVGTDQREDPALILRAEPKSRLLNRRLLFEMVDEILTQRYLFYPWLSNFRPVPSGNLLLTEVWSRLCDYDFPQGEDLQHTVENLIEKYLTKDDNWMDLRVHAEAIGMDLESELLNEVFEETLCCFALL